jgi:hypothetical protein
LSATDLPPFTPASLAEKAVLESIKYEVLDNLATLQQRYQWTRYIENMNANPINPYVGTMDLDDFDIDDEDLDGLALRPATSVQAPSSSPES